MKLSLLAFTVLAGLLSGCNRIPVAVPVESLVFPAVLITGTHPSKASPTRVEVIANPAALGHMAQGTYVTINDSERSDPPIVIDATAAAFDMKDIVGKHGGLWMMANPTSWMPIDYKLFPRERTGIAAAREIVASARYLGPDLDQDRTKLRVRRISKAASMTDIIEILDEVPPTDDLARPHPFEAQG